MTSGRVVCLLLFLHVADAPAVGGETATPRCALITTAEVTLIATGQPARSEKAISRTRKHVFPVVGLQDNTEYTATASGVDFSGRRAPVAEVQFVTSSLPAESSQRDSWLRVRGKYIVDSSGKPFPLLQRSITNFRT